SRRGAAAVVEGHVAQETHGAGRFPSLLPRAILWTGSKAEAFFDGPCQSESIECILFILAGSSWFVDSAGMRRWGGAVPMMGRCSRRAAVHTWANEAKCIP
ncbi:unnamed protein product, partial [Heterosigma akashiwo]